MFCGLARKPLRGAEIDGWGNDSMYICVICFEMYSTEGIIDKADLCLRKAALHIPDCRSWECQLTDMALLTEAPRSLNQHEEVFDLNCLRVVKGQSDSNAHCGFYTLRHNANSEEGFKVFMFRQPHRT